VRRKSESSESPSSRWLSAIFWGVFAIGLLVQVFSPHLKVQNHAFAAPPSLLSAGKTISPAPLVAKERTVQSLSAFLTIVGALGLGWCYWEWLFGRTSS
jgi:hypothetical protein